MVVFWGEGKPEYPEKTSRCREENQQTQPTYDARSGNRTRDKLVGGECSHQCAIPAPLKYLFICTTCTTNKSTRQKYATSWRRWANEIGLVKSRKEQTIDWQPASPQFCASRWHGGNQGRQRDDFDGFKKKKKERTPAPCRTKPGPV